MPDADPSHAPELIGEPAQELHGLDAGELLARGVNTVRPPTGSGSWEPPTPAELGRLLPQYRIEQLLGRGGMGAVYKGIQPGLERPIAIKILPAEIADEEFVNRFKREARTLARLQHSRIITVHDFGQTNQGHLYFVMEYIDGSDLRTILKGPGLTAQQALLAVSQICDALYAAHKQGVIHRDIKPENILISRDGYVKLADFGLARPLEEGPDTLTSANTVMGTAAYMAPEQRTGNADHRSDIYALGVTLYEMLTGQRPQGIFDMPSVKVQVDVRLDQVVVKALQQAPERRYQQVSEMKTDLDLIRTTPNDKGPPSLTQSSYESTTVGTEPSKKPASARIANRASTSRRHARWPVRTILVSLTALAICTAATWFAWSLINLNRSREARQLTGPEAHVANVHAQSFEPADLFVSGYQAMQAGEKAEQAGNLEEALSKLRDAAQMLDQASEKNPAWQPSVIAYRKKTTAEAMSRVRSALLDSQEPQGRATKAIRCLKPLELSLRRNQDDDRVAALPQELIGLAREASDQFERGDFRDAQTSYERALVKAPTSIQLLNNFAITLFRQRKYELAEQAIRKAKAIAPEDVFTHRTGGIFYYEQGKYDEAVAELTKALAINPKDAAAHYSLGMASCRKGWQEAAEKELETAIALEPNYADAHFNLAGVSLLKTSANKEQSRKYYQRAVELGAEPDSALEQMLK